MIKAIFFDIDGTLIDEEKDIVPESAVQALKKAKENGSLLFLCSGRCLAIIPEDIMALGFDGMVGGCGTYIEIGGRGLSPYSAGGAPERSGAGSDAVSHRWCTGGQGMLCISPRLLDACGKEYL